MKNVNKSMQADIIRNNKLYDNNNNKNANILFSTRDNKLKYLIFYFFIVLQFYDSQWKITIFIYS